MADLSSKEVAEIACIFVNLGAPEKQAVVMASQLIKRAEQISQERDISKVEATESLPVSYTHLTLPTIYSV